MADPFTLAVSVAALLVSIVSALVASRIASRQNSLQERLLTLETAREKDRQKQTRSAELRASIERGISSTSRSTRYSLVIRNEGMAGARNVRVLLNGNPARQHPMIPRGEDDISTLGTGAEFRYTLAVSLGTPRVLDISIHWDDDSGEARTWESQLKL